MTRCIHELVLMQCAYCSPNAQDDDDLPEGKRFFKPIRSWGGEGTVPVMGRDGRPVNIPSAMQFMWMVGGREDDRAARLSAIAFSRVPKTAAKQGRREPLLPEREDIAQDALLQFMEWTAEQEDPNVATEDIKQLCYFVGVQYFRWLNLSSKMDIRPIDWETGIELGLVERWAEPGDYLPLLGVLKSALAADQRTIMQQRLVNAWAIFDPEFTGAVTRNTQEFPLSGAERMVLLRCRAQLGGAPLNPFELAQQESSEAAQHLLSLLPAA